MKRIYFTRHTKMWYNKVILLASLAWNERQLGQCHNSLYSNRIGYSNTERYHLFSVSWGCRIRRLHFCRGVRPPPHPNEATCWPWMAIRKALRRNSGGWAVIDPATKWSMTCNIPLWPLFGLTGGRISPIQSIGWSYQVLAPIYFIPTVLLNLHLQQVPIFFLLLVARRQWLRVNCIERIGIWPVLRTWNWQRLRSLPSTRVYWSRFPVSTKANGLPPWFIPNTSWIPWWVEERRASEKYTVYMASSNKKSKQYLSESDLENEAADFPRFIVIESLEEVCLAKFSPFLIEKVISTRASPKTVKKTWNGNFLVDVDSRR